MSTANSIITAQSVKSAQAVATAAKTTFNDTTNAVLLLTAGASGSVLYSLKAMPRATVTATKLELYRSPDNGVTLYYVNDALMAAYSMANTTASGQTDFGYTETTPMRLGAGEQLYVGIAVALSGGIVFSAQYEDL